MGAGVVTGHSTTHTNQVFPTPSTSTNNRSQSVGLNSQPGVSPLQASTKTTSIMSNKVQTCETCDIAFTFFKRKKICKDCHRYFCSTCLPKPPSNQQKNGRQCNKCTILMSGKFTRQQLQDWRVKDMRCFLDARNISTSTCKEKHDLIDLVVLHFCVESNSAVQQEQNEHDRLVGELADRMHSSSFHTTLLPNAVPPSGDNIPPSSNAGLTNPELESSSHPEERSGHIGEEIDNHQDENNRTNTENYANTFERIMTMNNTRLQERQWRELREAMERLREEFTVDEPETRPSIQRTTIDDVKSENDVENLTVRQLKEVLVNNFVDYRGCCEKHELVERVKRLWNEEQANKRRAAAAVSVTEVSTVKEGTVTESSDQLQPAEASTKQVEVYDPEKDICRICMDSAIDCILLECGHMVTCTKCGKRLADCPICRQYITRVVHIFRS